MEGSDLVAVAKKETTEDINKMTAAQCRTAYRKIKSGSYCHECDEFKSKDKFYKSIKTKSGLIPTCKSCLYKIGTGYDEKTKKTNETRETIIAALRKADLPFIEDLYKQCCEAITNEVSGRKKETVFSQIIVCLQSLPQYSGMTFEDSEFLDDEEKKSLNYSVLDSLQKIIYIFRINMMIGVQEQKLIVKVNKHILYEFVLNFWIFTKLKKPERIQKSLIDL